MVSVRFTRPGVRSISPAVVRYDPFHELVEEGHSECRVPVIGAPDHALGDELIACGTQCRHLSIQALGNVT